MFYLDSTTQKRYTLGTPFTYNGVQYTAAGATHARFVSLGFNQVVNISDLPNTDRLDSTIFKNSKGGYYPEPVLQKQSDILLSANFITIKSRKSILGFVEVEGSRCNFKP